MADETALVAAFIATSLAPLGVDVYEGTAPADAPEPFVTFQFVSTPDVTTMSGDIVFARFDVDVKAVCSGGSFDPITSISDGIKAALHGVRHHAVDGGQIVTSRRIASLRLPQTVGGKPYRHLGGTYRIEAKGA